GNLEGAPLTAASFSKFIGPYGEYVVTLGIIFFAFSTIVGWSYYGEKCFAYLINDKAIPYYRIAFVLAIMYAAVEQLDIVWRIGASSSSLIAMPHMIRLRAPARVIAYRTTRSITLSRA